MYRVVSGPESDSGSDSSPRDSLRRVFSSLGGGVLWRAVFGAGLLVGVLPFVVSVVLLNVYVATEWLANTYFDDVVEGLVGGSGAVAFGTAMARFGTPLLSFGASVAAALFVGRRVGSLAPLHGVLIGFFAVIFSNLATVPFFGPPQPYEILTYPVVFVGGGLLGGMKGWEIRAGEEAMRRANRAVGVARSPRDVVGAIGENLAGSNINGVSLWTLGVGESGGFELLGSWTARGERELQPELGFGSVRELRRLNHPVRLRDGEVSGADRAAWQRRGVRSALLLPLNRGDAYGFSSFGLMMITSGKGRGFSGRDERAYSTVAATAALAMENLRLIEAARTAGKHAGVLDERQRLAHEIHDTLAQGFTSIVTNLEAAEGSFDSGRGESKRHMDNARAIARESLSEARRLVWALRPGQLEDAPLPDAVKSLVERWSRETGVSAEAIVTGEARPLPAAVEDAALRVAQESLTNIAKHANATRAALTLSYMPTSITIDARDDGVGFDVAARNGSSSDGSGFGLRAMRERVEKVGGRLSVESEPGEGVAVSVEMPVPESVARLGEVSGR